MSPSTVPLRSFALRNVALSITAEPPDLRVLGYEVRTHPDSMLSVISKYYLLLANNIFLHILKVIKKKVTPLKELLKTFLNS